MTLPSVFDQMRMPVIGAPLFIVSVPELVIAQCKAGIIGSFPALNARPVSMLDEWLDQIISELDSYNKQNPARPAAPFAVNQIVHKTNERLEEDLELCVKYKVPMIITSLGARKELNDAVHSYGGIVMHDVINHFFAQKALEKGADGLIAVCAGAGGHAGTLSPLAFIQELRTYFDGPLALSGCIANGGAVAAAQAMGADFAYIGSAFIACDEANANDAYKDMVVDSRAEEVVYTNLFSGVHGNYLTKSVVECGYDPENLPVSDPSKMNFGSGGNQDAKVWKDIKAAGQGVGGVHERVSVAGFVDRLEEEYMAAINAVSAHRAFRQFQK